VSVGVHFSEATIGMGATISSGSTRPESIADANGWISSGHLASYNQSIDEHLEQKCLSEWAIDCFLESRFIMAL